MKRRVLALAAASATALAVLPAAPAFAAAAATANLVGASAVYPGADKTFTIRVANTEMALLGKSINAIRVNLPVNEAGITLGSGAGTAPGFTEATATNLGTTQFITYRGGSLRPGSAVEITFPTTVGAPLAKDLLGDFRVQVSSDNFQTAKNASGNLLAKVQVLEVIQAGLKPVAPTNAAGKGVVDRTGTAGQSITYASEVRNYSRSALTVAAGLTSNGGEQPGSGTVSVPAGGTAVASIPVTLTQNAGARTFTGTATATGAEAPTKNDTFTVQAPALLTPASIDGTRTKSGTGSARDFVIRTTKTNTPAVDALTASLRFGSNTCGVVGPVTFPAGSSSQELTFRCASITGADGPLAAEVVYSLTDDNLATYGRSVSVGNVVIDNIAPILDLVVGLPNDADGDKQTAVRNGNTITVSGNVDNAGDLSGNTVRVTLQPDAGAPIVIDAPVSGEGEKRTFSGSANGTSTQFDAAATQFTSRVEAADAAGNTGAFQAPGSVVIDNLAPVLTNPGVIVEANKIEVAFTDRTGARGGCDARMWLIDGSPNRVSSVTAGDGADCATTSSLVRQLVLSSPLGVDQTPTVTYDPTFKRTLLGTRPVKDGAGNDGLRAVIDTVTVLVPQAPPIVSLERRDGAAGAAFEPAYLDTDENRYFTNVGGAEALRLTVGGIRSGYTVQVLNGGSVVAERTYGNVSSPLGGSGSTDGDLLVPLRTTDGASAFSVRLVSSQGNTGAGTPFTVVLDRAAPRLLAPTISGSTVTSTFGEKVVLGSDFADNWFVSETVQGESGPVRRTVNVDSVTADGLTVRKLEVTLLDASQFAGVDYFRQSGTRYEDRAGNGLADTLQLQG